MTVAKPKTKAELVLTLKYQMRVHLLHCRMFRRLRGVLATITFLGGSSVVVSAIQALPIAVTSAAVVVAMTGFLDWLMDPAEKAAQHVIHRSQAADLLSRSGSMKISDLESAMATHDSDLHLQFESLRNIAFNDALKSSGFEDGMRPETRLQRLFRCMA